MFDTVYDRKLIALRCLMQFKLYDWFLKIIQGSQHIMLFNQNDTNVVSTLYYATKCSGNLTKLEELQLLEVLSTVSSINILNFKIKDCSPAEELQHPYLHLFLLAGFEFENPIISEMRQDLIYLGSSFLKNEVSTSDVESTLLFSSFGLGHKLLLDDNALCELKKNYIMQLARKNEEDKEYRLF